ncbi:MAG: hypothetical protein HYY55_01880 [Candidatus Niyogibacteria bacterium]|nr:MAG: hypothetical protein HYY55_01880 [Candidatus Niyogibacteria bacterium]
MFERFMTDKRVEKRYAEAGRIFGHAVSYIYMGECIGFDSMLAKWEKLEAEYAKRGYRTLPVDDFVAHGGYGTPLKNLSVKRAEGEEPVFHARIYREVYLGKIRPVVNLSELMRPIEPGESPESRAQVGTYFVPSTKKAE